MNKFRYLVVAIDDCGGSITYEVRAWSKWNAEDIFKLIHAGENLEIVEIKYLGL